MLIAYPESKIDLSIVYDGDVISFRKESGKVEYSHEIASPFARDDSSVIGGYCVIKNVRGEFLTTLTREEIDKHRKIARTDSIWKQWFVEMATKTVIKKACSQHFRDVFEKMESDDNESYDLAKLDVKEALKQSADSE
jgi:recombinational DNA repair protein RecT